MLLSRQVASVGRDSGTMCLTSVMGGGYIAVFVNGSVEGTLLEDFVSAIAARHDLLPDEVNVESIHVGEGGYQLRVCVLERLCMEIEVYRSKGARSLRGVWNTLGSISSWEYRAGEFTVRFRAVSLDSNTSYDDVVNRRFTFV